ncbi:MAG: hypothetical protein AAF456_12345, partial [Planctomycetota bacterium]
MKYHKILRQQRTRNSGYERLEPRQMLATFNGTAASDVVIVSFVNGVPATVEINGNLQSNPD